MDRTGNPTGPEPAEGWPAGTQLAPGTRVGRYQILAAIGRGGMGEVYAAYHPDLDRRIALKVVFGERAADPDRQRRLLREAQIIARLNHPNIVTVHDAGVIGERVYVAMEFVDGQTISAWLKEKPRAWQEIVQVFLAAGQGLAAAHAAEIVHRDFKPQNVMIGTDGRVRVMDFGLARPLQSEEPVPAPGAAPAGEPTVSTTVGALVGTPAYMAPEQLVGGRADMRSDQFSFCVALHEAIHGVRPGVRPEPEDHRTARRAPPWLNAVVRRGIEPESSRRFASMNELLRALEQGRNRVRHRVALVAAGLLMVIAVVGATQISRTRQFSCAPPKDRLEAVWPAEGAAGQRRGNLHARFSASGLSGAEALWTRVASALDRHVHDWSAMYQATCEATHVRREQSPEVLDLRMTCLGDNLDEVRAYVDAVMTTDPLPSSHAVETVEALTPVARCADVKNLRLQIPLPEDPAVRQKVQALQQRLKTIETLLAVRSDKAEQQLKDVEPEIRQLHYRPLLGQFLLRRGWASCETSPLEARPIIEEALLVAESSHDDLSVARAADLLAYTETVRGRFERARQWLSFGDSVVDRIHAHGSLTEAWLLNEWGNFYFDTGNLTAALESQRRAIDLKRSLLGPNHPDVARSILNLSNILAELNRWDEALATLRAAASIFDRYGDQDPVVPSWLALNKGHILLHIGRLDEAEADLEKARSIGGRSADGVFMSEVLTALAELRIAQRRPREGLALARRAQALEERIGEENHLLTSATRFCLAQTLTALSMEASQARELAFQACDGFAQSGFTARHSAVLAWFNGLKANRANARPATSCADLLPRGSRSARPPVRELEQDDVGGGAVGEVAGGERRGDREGAGVEGRDLGARVEQVKGRAQPILPAQDDVGVDGGLGEVGAAHRRRGHGRRQVR
jgi:serine/threonine protein kinase